MCKREYMKASEAFIYRWQIKLKSAGRLIRTVPSVAVVIMFPTEHFIIHVKGNVPLNAHCHLQVTKSVNRPAHKNPCQGIFPLVQQALKPISQAFHGRPQLVYMATGTDTQHSAVAPLSATRDGCHSPV